MTCRVCDGEGLVPDKSVGVLGNRPCAACWGDGEVDSWKLVSAAAIVPRWSGIICVSIKGNHIHRELQH